MSEAVRQFYEIVAERYWAPVGDRTEVVVDLTIKQQAERLVCTSVEDMRGSLLYVDDRRVIEKALEMAKRHGWKTAAKVLEVKLKMMVEA